jgi:hypothetical protein
MTAGPNKTPTAFLVVGTHSGVGKTTVTLTLLADDESAMKRTSKTDRFAPEAANGKE